jgi:NCS2 family nucleobase:cation symporter-2
VRRPAQLVYGAEDVPPSAVMLLSGLQHVVVVTMFFVYPLIVMREAGIAALQVADILRVGMLVLALGTLVQALPIGPVGSRLLAPVNFTALYFPASLLAVKAGGMPLVWGMTVFAGVLQLGLAVVWSRLRAFVPPEMGGLVGLLVGATIALAALRTLAGHGVAGEVSGSDVAIMAASLATMIGLNVWSRGTPRMFCVLIGLVVGYAAAALAGDLSAADWARVSAQPLLAWPALTWAEMTFDVSMVVPFAVTAVAATLSSAAIIASYQRLNDADWVRPDEPRVRGGILGDGLTAIVGGLLGTHGAILCNGSVGAVAATGVSSRRIGYAAAAILALAAFVPLLAGLLTLMPPAVMAAALLFTAPFVMINGVQLLVTRVLDSRRTLTIGLSLAAFLSAAVFPGAFAQAPPWASSFVSSPLVLALVVALVLNLVFRIGVRRRVELSCSPGAHMAQAVSDFIETAAGAWGARRDVMIRVDAVVQQALEIVAGHGSLTGPVLIDLSFDEFDVDVRLSYEGVELVLSDELPTHEAVIDGNGTLALAGYLVRRQSDRVLSGHAAGRSWLEIRFRH